MSLDIGGTTRRRGADRATAQPQYGTGERIGDFQIFIPSVSVSSIGEGGGSIAWVDRARRAEGRPGERRLARRVPPATGAAATRADHHRRLRRLRAGSATPTLGYGAVRVDCERARAGDRAAGRAAWTSDRARPRRRSSDVAVSGMYAGVSGAGLALRHRSARVRLPRLRRRRADAGLLPRPRARHARRSSCPPAPGVLSALGGLIADLKNDFVDDRVSRPAARCDAGPRCVGRAAAGARAEHWLRHEQRHDGPRTDPRTRPRCAIAARPSSSTRRSRKMRSPRPIGAIADAFHARARARLWPRRPPTTPVQIVALRLVVAGETPKPATAAPRRADGAARRACARCRCGSTAPCAPCRSTTAPTLRAGHRFAGPAVVTQDDCTTVHPARLRRARRRSRQAPHRGRGHERIPSRSTTARPCRSSPITAPPPPRAMGVHADAHRALHLRQGDRGFLLPGADAGRPDLRLAEDVRRHLVHRPRLRRRRSAHRTTARATSASPATPTPASSRPTRRTSTSGSRCSTTARSSASSATTSTTPTSAAPCRPRLSRTLTEIQQEGCASRRRG